MAEEFDLWDEELVAKHFAAAIELINAGAWTREPIESTQNTGWPILLLNMNDTFAFACADAEEVPFDKLVEVRDLYLKYGYHGLTAWVARKRQDWPIHCKCHHDDDPKFLAACNELGYSKPS